MKMNSEQIRMQVEKYLAGGGRIQELKDDNTRFFFPVCEDERFNNLLDKFVFNEYEEDERFFDMAE